MKRRSDATTLRVIRAGGFIIACLVFASAFAAPVLVGTPVNFTATQGLPFTGAVATFTSTNPANVAADFTATINWGDGTTTPGTITGGAGNFTVTGSHTYVAVGPFTATVTINDTNPVATVTVTDSVTVVPVLVGTPVNFTATQGVPFTGAVATFTSANPANVAADFTATINWGDGTTTPGTITGGAGNFTVTGTHTYAAVGPFTATVTIIDANPPATVTVTDSVTVVPVLIGTPVNFTAVKGVSFTGPVATFTSGNPANTVADFTATINWGDGTTSPGTITAGAGNFSVSGAHIYAAVGPFTATVTINDTNPVATVTVTDNVTVVPVLVGTPVNFTAVKGVSFTGPVATFTSANPANTVSDFTATINWGDGTTTAGTITAGAGNFSVSGAHTYAAVGPFTATVTINDANPVATVTVTDSVTVVPVLVGTPVNFTATQGTAFTGAVATFTSANPANTVADFTATINWGDGTTTTGTITAGAGNFSVSGTHTYATSVSFMATVVINDANPPATVTVTDSVTVVPVLVGTPVNFTSMQGASFTGAVATFTSANPANTAADFTATINWGDGTTTAGTVTGGAGNFTVSGTHTYATSGSFTATVVINDANPPATVTVTDSVTVSGALAPAQPIPTLGSWALAVLAVLLGVLALCFVPRRVRNGS